jgi:hypothetical protein
VVSRTRTPNDRKVNPADHPVLILGLTSPSFIENCDWLVEVVNRISIAGLLSWTMKDGGCANARSRWPSRSLVTGGRFPAAVVASSERNPIQCRADMNYWSMILNLGSPILRSSSTKSRRNSSAFCGSE